MGRLFWRSTKKLSAMKHNNLLISLHQRVVWRLVAGGWGWWVLCFVLLVNFLFINLADSLRLAQVWVFLPQATFSLHHIKLPHLSFPLFFCQSLSLPRHVVCVCFLPYCSPACCLSIHLPVSASCFPPPSLFQCFELLCPDAEWLLLKKNKKTSVSSLSLLD